jgi:hypothetical protein
MLTGESKHMLFARDTIETMAIFSFDFFDVMVFKLYGCHGREYVVTSRTRVHVFESLPEKSPRPQHVS